MLHPREENGEESYLRIGPISDVPRAPDKVEIGSPKIAYKRKYIQREHKIYEHPLWRKQGFWGTTLIESTLAQMRMTQPVLWDELNQDELRETVIGRIHPLSL